MFVLLPYPYIEAGVQSSRYSLKAVLGSTLWWGRGTLEVARKQTFGPKIDLFLNAGYEYVVMGYVARTYGAGVDILQDETRKVYLRLELEFYHTVFAESSPERDHRTIDFVLPSAGIGYRF